MNHDNQVSTTITFGIHQFLANGTTMTLGAAVNGDKMLAMCDWNRNGEVDHAEVFGDGTVDPFSGTELKAADGFEALNAVAKSAADRYPDLAILGNAKSGAVLVNLSPLRQALQRIQCDLGFISDQNIQKLELIGDAVSVQVTDYEHTPNDQIDGVAFAQKSYYLDSNGKKWGVTDVWFPQQAPASPK